MKEKRVTKKAIFASLLSVVVCSSMLIGTSYAWFTDTAVSSNNVIKSGTLNVELQYLDGGKETSGEHILVDPTAAKSTDWLSAESAPIFNYDKWEPGYCEVKHIRIANVGNLALHYQFNIIPSGTLDVNEEGHTLADAIDVYYFDPAVMIDSRDRAVFEQAKLTCSLSDALAGLGETGSGDLYPEGNPDNKSSADQVTIVLKMREDAGNEYQDMDLGASFSVQVIATQLTYEADSFDDQYDKDADTTPNFVSANTAEAFAGALEKAKDGDTIDAQGATVGKIEKGTFDKELTIENAIFDGGEGDRVNSISESTFNEPVTFKNCTFKSEGIDSSLSESGKNPNLFNGMHHNTFMQGAVFEDCTFEAGMAGFYSTYIHGDITFKNCTIAADWCYAFNVNGGSGENTVTFDGCTVKGWVSFDKSAVSKVVAKDTKFVKDGASYSTVRLYQDAEFTNCEFASDYNSMPNYGSIDCCAANVTVTCDAATYATIDTDNLRFVGTATGSKFVLDGTEIAYE